MDNAWDQIPSEEIITTTIESLKKNNITAELLSEEGAKRKVLELIPKGSEVFTMTSKTLEALGLAQTINSSSDYISVRNQLNNMDRNTQSREMRKLGTAPDVAVGSIHAVTQDGHVLIASRSGSQLPAYVYGAEKVIWVVGVQKIVKNIEEGKKRIFEYTLPLESERVKEAYGLPHSDVDKLLIYYKETIQDRIYLLFVNKVLGF